METIIVIDFGSYQSQVVARKVRAEQVYSEIVPWNTPSLEISAKKPLGIILADKPGNNAGVDLKEFDRQIFSLGIPILGIGFGLEVIKTQLETLSTNRPSDYESDTLVNDQLKLYGISDSSDYDAFLTNFLQKICGCSQNWTMQSFIKNAVQEIRSQIGNQQVVCGLSGGIDSSVAAVLVHKAVGDQLTCIYVDHGFMRKNESEEIEKIFSNDLDLNLVAVNSSQRFLSKLSNVSDPEEKRKLIGTEFIRVFEEEARKLDGVDYLVQGTLYPDVIESGFGEAAMIKSHHNVGGLPSDMELKLIEPLRQLFKDEVRLLAQELNLPDEIVWRHPFPGPGLAIRIIGEVTKEKLDILREADAIYLDELRKAGWYRKIWQALAVLTNNRTVGKRGDMRTYEYVLALRAVNSEDGMVAKWVPIPHDLLDRIGNRIMNEVPGINRVVYDISSKPPATIEWE